MQILVAEECDTTTINNKLLQKKEEAHVSVENLMHPPTALLPVQGLLASAR